MGEIIVKIPMVGDIIHNMVEEDPEGIASALNGGIFAVYRLKKSIYLFPYRKAKFRSFKNDFFGYRSLPKSIF